MILAALSLNTLGKSVKILLTNKFNQKEKYEELKIGFWFE